MLKYFFLLYLVLARLFKIWSSKVQIHSIIHCVTAFLVTTYVLFISTGNNPLSTNIREILIDIPPSREWMFRLIIFHSLGYFIADTLDIIIDYTNVKRRIYLLHHVAAIGGLSTVYWGSYGSVYPIWALEIGGIVHHLKHMSETYYPLDENQRLFDVGPFIYIIIQGLYHIVYVMSRLLLTVNVYTAFTWICYSEHIKADIIGLMIACVLIVQNLLWWLHNIKKIFVLY